MAQLPQAIFVTRVEWFPKVRTFAQAIVANRWFIEFMETMPTYLFVLQTLKISIPDSKLRSRRLSTLAGKKGPFFGQKYHSQYIRSLLSALTQWNMLIWDTDYLYPARQILSGR